MSRDLLLSDNTKLEWMSKNPNLFLNKSIVLYGLSGTGKTSIIVDILYFLRNHISFPFIITKSQASAERNYGKCVPRGCIKWNLSKEWLETFIIKQSERAKIYDEVNKLENLKKVFDMIDNNTGHVIEMQIINDAECRIQAIELNHNLSFPKKSSLKKGIFKARDEALSVLYKKFIRAYRVELEGIHPEMSRVSQLVVKFLDFMPHALLVFDDCAFMIKQWVKESTAIKNLFYQGRHYYTTFLLGTQADKELDPELRKSAYISVFTTIQDVISGFSKASNAFPEHDRKKAMLCANAVFKPDGIVSCDNYQKLVYIRQDVSNPFRYTIAELHEEEDFRIGADCVWELDEMLYPRDKEKKTDARIYDKYINL
jgi:hypothetical protein